MINFHASKREIAKKMEVDRLPVVHTDNRHNNKKKPLRLQRGKEEKTLESFQAISRKDEERKEAELKTLRRAAASGRTATLLNMGTYCKSKRNVLN